MAAQATAPPAQTNMRSRSRTSIARRLAPYLWLAPALGIYSVFKLVPLLGGIWLALLRWDGIAPPVFVGLLNFRRMLTDERLGPALLHNVQYAVGTVAGKIVLALFLALLLNGALRGRGFYRTTLFLPVVMSFVVVGILWSWLFNDQFGLINNLLRAIGLGALAPDWLGDTRIALVSLMLVDIWKWYGFHMVIFLAGLQTIPQELYEAARVDGASRWRQFTAVTLPLLQPVMLVNVTLSLMGGFNVFDIPYVMTEGGPANATNVLALHTYIQAFKFNRLGYGAALSYALLVLVTLIALVQIKLMARDETR
ncbi:MAG: sugar ABC transporter permease [Chloroflexales bacterium]|nr:sugar ABC transporter permease [Chloroflexales bacterium]